MTLKARTMSQDRTVLLRPVISEKSYGLMDQARMCLSSIHEPQRSRFAKRSEEAFAVRVRASHAQSQGQRKRNRRQATFGTGQTPSVRSSA